MREVLEAEARRRVGQVLGGQWTLLRYLDLGGMAAVFEGIGADGVGVAVKVLHGGYAGHAEVRKRFQEEAYVANRLGHPGTVRVLADGVLADGTAYLVMDLLRGVSLETALERRGRIEPAAALWITDAVLDVLATAHAHGTIHRDIKPPNVFLTRSGEVKLLDFGLARLKERSLRGELTAEGTVVGTAAYMPPEQARGNRDKIDARTDIWAVGATLFRMLTGRAVHTGKGNERLFQAISNAAPPLRDVAPELPPSVCRVVDTALQFGSANRWPTAEAMRAAVQHSLTELGPAGRLDARRTLLTELAALGQVEQEEEDLGLSVLLETDET